MNALGELVGVELGPTSWLDVTQERIDGLAEATEDPRRRERTRGIRVTMEAVIEREMPRSRPAPPSSS